MAVIIKSDTTWATGTEHVLEDVVQVAPGATLNIEAGAYVRAVNGSTIQVFGHLAVDGDDQSHVVFRNVGVEVYTAAGADISNADFIRGSLYFEYSRESTVTNSWLYQSGISIRYPQENIHIDSNTIYGSMYVGAYAVDSENIVSISNNTFIPPDDYYPSSIAIDVWYNGNDRNVFQINGNNFVGFDVAIRNDSYTEAILDARGNWYGTDEFSLIDDMIHGDNYDLLLSPVDYSNFLRGISDSAPEHGSASDDTIIGGSSVDRLFGLDGNDHIEGGEGDDWIAGGAGRDRLWGGGGSDLFIFNFAPQKSNLDKILDFDISDSFEIVGGIFPGIVTGQLKSKAFVIGKKAKDDSDRIIYDRKKGALLFDEDGSYGGYKAIKFAKIPPKLDLSFEHFIVV